MHVHMYISTLLYIGSFHSIIFSTVGYIIFCPHIHIFTIWITQKGNPFCMILPQMTPFSLTLGVSALGWKRGGGLSLGFWNRHMTPGVTCLYGNKRLLVA